MLCTKFLEPLKKRLHEEQIKRIFGCIPVSFIPPCSSSVFVFIWYVLCMQRENGDTSMGLRNWWCEHEHQSVRNLRQDHFPFLLFFFFFTQLLQELARIHQALHRDLKDAQNNTSGKTISEVFLENQEQLIIYGEYCANLVAAQQEVEDVMNNNEEVRNLIQVGQGSQGSAGWRFSLVQLFL